MVTTNNARKLWCYLECSCINILEPNILELIHIIMCTTATPIRGVVFDVMGTLVPLTGVQHRLVQRGVPADAAEVRVVLQGASSPPLVAQLWFARVQRDGMAASLGGTCPSMREVGAHHVQALASGFALADEVAAEVLDGAADDLVDDVAPALCKLAKAGVLVGTLTNGSHKTSLAALARAGVPAVDETLQLEVRT